MQHIVDTSEGLGRAKALRNLAAHIVYLGVSNSFDQYISLQGEALEISEELGDTALMIKCHATMGRELTEAGFFREGISHAKAALQLAPPGDSILRSTSFRIYSYAYRGLEMYDSALFFWDQAARYFDKSVSCAYRSSTYNDLGKIYTQMGDHQATLKAYKQAYDLLFNCSADPERYHQGSAARALGYTYLTGGDYRQAIHYFRVADTVYARTDKRINRNKIYHAQQPSNIARAYQHWGRLDSALHYRQLALKRFTDYGVSERNMNVPNQYCYMGTIYREMGDFALAGEYFDRSLELRKQINDSLGVGMCLDEMAEMARLRGMYMRAVEMLQEALLWKSSFSAGRIDPSRQAQHTESRSETYLYLGKVFADWNKFDDALLYYDTSLMLCRPLNFTRGEALVNYYKGLTWQGRGEADSAEAYFQRSITVSESMGNEHLAARARTGLGKLLLEKGKLEMAMQYFQTALDIYREGGFVCELPELFLNIGTCMSEQGYDEAAIREYEKAYEDAASMNMHNIRAEAACALADLFEKRGETGTANRYLRDYIQFHDSVFTLETHRQLAEMQALHESQQKGQQIIQLEQQNVISELQLDRSRYAIFILGGIVIIILLFSVLFIRQLQIRNQQKVLLNQQRLFRSQMNPHFIFNSLTNIQHYIFNKDSLAAGRYLAVFAKLMRSILNNSRKEFISLRDEAETIRQYLELQKLRMEEKLDYDLFIDENLDQEVTEIPPMLAQPFIENAIEHGLRNKEEGGKVTIRILDEGEVLSYEIHDNGVGRKQAAKIEAEKKKDHESMAVSLTLSRLKSLWGRKAASRIFEIIDLEDDEGNATGTLVRFKIPLN